MFHGLCVLTSPSGLQRRHITERANTEMSSPSEQSSEIHCIQDEDVSWLMDSLGIAQEQVRQWLHLIVSHVTQCKHTAQVHAVQIKPEKDHNSRVELQPKHHDNLKFITIKM